ncbi:hypothetical protein SeMB42_g06473 [Synchytrium endobioticum]|uniref:GATA-type domain-containing protein n=1 Tax=Synchytrium endobioticum TaxID=286115 RepID=A0A507CHS2_9FUNG|nr:hypothetical protein SeMB42_g06473 [Synchytrium endobioticum]
MDHRPDSVATCQTHTLRSPYAAISNDHVTQDKVMRVREITDQDPIPPLVVDESRWECNYCGSKTTTLKRQGPQEYQQLCNPCASKWSRGKILPQYPKALYPPKRSPYRGRRQRPPSTYQAYQSPAHTPDNSSSACLVEHAGSSHLIESQQRKSIVSPAPVDDVDARRIYLAEKLKLAQEAQIMDIYQALSRR